MSVASQIAKVGVLRMNSQGIAVRTVQEALKSLGYALKGTSYFGGATETAVEDFQRRHGLTADGAVGPKTAEAIDTEVDTHVARGVAAVEQPRAAEIARPLWLADALKDVGLKEAPGAADNPQIIEWAHEIGGDTAKAYTHDEIPWCALFISKCLTRVGLRPSDQPLWALSYAHYGIKLPGPAVGSIRSMSRAGGGHVIFVIGRDKAGNIVGVGGNQSDAVNIRSFPRDRFEADTWPAGVPGPALIGFNNLPLVSAAGGVLSTKES